MKICRERIPKFAAEFRDGDVLSIGLKIGKLVVTGTEGEASSL